MSKMNGRNKLKDSELSADEIKMATKKLTSDEQLEVCRQLASYRSVKDVDKFCREMFGKTLHPNSIRLYLNSQKWKPLIQKFRDEYTRGIMEVPIANKRVRLEELQSMFEKYKDGGRLRLAQAVLKDAREELDGSRKFGDTNVYMTQVNNYKDMSDEEIESERLRQLENLQKVRSLKGRAEYENKQIPEITPEEYD